MKVAQEGVPRDPRDLRGLQRHCGGPYTGLYGESREYPHCLHLQGPT